MVAITIAWMLTLPGAALASPGGLDAFGCHVCRTNCAAYNLEVGERHCHRVAKREETISAHTVAAQRTNQIDGSRVGTGIVILLLGILCGVVVLKHVSPKSIS